MPGAEALTVAVLDVGSPENLGWAADGPVAGEGADLDGCVEAVTSALQLGPVALGFEAPLFVPMRSDPRRLAAARSGETGMGQPNRPFSAGAGAAVLVTALVVVPYVLDELRRKAPASTARLDWRRPLEQVGQLLLFEAFVTNQRQTGGDRHVADARAAIAAFRQGFADPAAFESAILEPSVFNLLGAALLRTGWTSDLAVLHAPCLVVRAGLPSLP